MVPLVKCLLCKYGDPYKNLGVVASTRNPSTGEVELVKEYLRLPGQPASPIQ